MKLIILGNGGLASEVQSLAELLGHEVVAKLTSTTIELIAIIPHDGVVIGVGNPEIKKILYKECQKYKFLANFVSLISPHAFVDKRAIVNRGSIVQHGAVLMPGVYIHEHCYININATVGHNTVIEEYSTVNPGANVSGDVYIKKGVFVGTGAQILEKLIIEEKSIIGAGSVVINNTEENSTYVGVPARKIK